MRRRVFAVGALVFAGCVSVKVVPGRPMTQLPPGLAWCGGSSQVVTRPRQSRVGEFPPESFKHCSRVLLDEDPNVTDAEWEGSAVFGLTTDDAGRVTDVCLWGANFGDPVQFVGCVATVLRTYNPALPPRWNKQPYIFTYIMD